MDGLPAPRYIMPIILPSYQYCDEQQFQTLSCAHYTIFPVDLIKLDLVIQALLLDYILGLKKIHVRLACILFLYTCIEINIFEHFYDKIYNKKY